ncbi:MAG: 16S rRNA (guanine(966)-N(2))-methyltransferase RsmD [Bacteroidales bacterium]
MRITGGELRGRAILPPKGFKARPTTDFAKEGLFNTLMNICNFEEIKVLDLFSGTGSISYEFASRGVKSIISVEMNSLYANHIRKNADKFGIKNIQVVRHNVFDFLNICKEKYDLVFADPPYIIEGLENIPEKIFNSGILNENAILILEHPGSYSFENQARFLKEKKYGNVHFTFFK